MPVTETPGTLLRALRAGREWNQAVLAEVLGKPTQWVSEVETGKKSVTAETALKREAALGVPARTWLHLQCEVDLRKAMERGEEQP